jgi:ERCC4-type nuclease
MTRMKMKTSLILPQRYLIIDSNENTRTPYVFPSGCKTKSKRLQVGDYALESLEGYNPVERKQINDLANCCAKSRDHFRSQWERLSACANPHLVLDCSVRDILNHNYRSQVHPNSILGTVISWQAEFPIVSVWWAGNAIYGASLTRRILVAGEKVYDHGRKGEGSVPDGRESGVEGKPSQ